ncbi:PREDICTED: ATP-dependent RNA helicase SUPV3L1, mitochondrial-like isoform X2 [Amphimedon queenslandica]|uniref:RNA helicase n=1 Tax=Amphimedon queenslandica TaxID=400682 RepID=A0A1X7UX90_AMPQE|nr:PREDICTED: ATP-dependent RNA helicase SUPV3L1, mitochondrial-like isoform X2 [Amphimedon queenslandica]|eukprot:XP_019851879.1 PREDICTED: ATP-dependent RNA helicase SUPV3L1, mitochondrial-like isoform X2 [Amphimedon queenslandica]
MILKMWRDLRLHLRIAGRVWRSLKRETVPHRTRIWSYPVLRQLSEDKNAPEDLKANNATCSKDKNGLNSTTLIQTDVTSTNKEDTDWDLVGTTNSAAVLEDTDWDLKDDNPVPLATNSEDNNWDLKDDDAVPLATNSSDTDWDLKDDDNDDVVPLATNTEDTDWDLKDSNTNVPPTSPVSLSISEGDLVEMCEQLKGREKLLKSVAAGQGITGEIYDEVLTSFCELLQDPTQYSENTALSNTVESIHRGSTHVDSLFTYFINHAHKCYPLLYVLPQLKNIADLTSPAQWYPAARAMKRHFVIHAGPTNSGKTHKALEAFYNASSGIYCAPLRMLAQEIYFKSNDQGVECDLITGEERIYVSGSPEKLSNHTSCTIEMASTAIGEEFDVAIIDEAQMVRDTERGGAWTRAILGVPAKEIHLCGEESVISIIRSIAESVGDTVEVKRYERLTPLIPLKRSLIGNYYFIRPGDCVIVFSRRLVFEVKDHIERATGRRCAIVYGGLPSVNRREQAELFNSPTSGFDILVATDAIGMGLNLHIRRILFHSVSKVARGNLENLSSSQLKQISGRAGRYGSFNVGIVTTFFNRDMPYFQEAFKKKIADIDKAGLTPTLEQLQLFSKSLPNLKLHELLSVFSMAAKLDGRYFLCEDKMQEWRAISEVLSVYNLDLKDAITFCLCPVNLNVPLLRKMFSIYAAQVSEKKPVTYEFVKRALKWPFREPQNSSDFFIFEKAHEVMDTYLWLGQRFPEYFPHSEKISLLQKDIENIIGSSLRKRRSYRRGISVAASLFRPIISHRRGSPLSRVRIIDEELPTITPSTYIYKSNHYKQ